MRPLTAVAVSGGIDSLAAAWLLKREGRRVWGVHFTTGYEAEDPTPRIKAIGRALDIDVTLIDLSDAFRQAVVIPFVRTYLTGRTPNPCLMCNPAIKLGALLEVARQRGADRLATGHYARIIADDRGRPRLFRGVDRWKDQSYFLAFLDPEQLARASFPLGDMTRDGVARLVEEAGLSKYAARESQDVCFIPKSGYADFVVREAGVIPSPGPIVDRGGREIGTHPGLHRFTVGQRRGIDCPGPAPYYVIRLDVARNRLVVGSREDLFSAGCHLSGVRWGVDPPSGPVECRVRLRYRHRAVPARLVPRSGGRAEVRFDRPVSAVTPGQGAVGYAGDRVLAAGWIQGGNDG